MDSKPGLNILDEARGQLTTVLTEVESLRRDVIDETLPMSQRIEAYGDIIASEVGDTLMSRARNLEREYGLRQLYLKFEGSNPSGTQKDRIAFAQVEDAFRQGYQQIITASCGNYGVALAFAASLAGIHCRIYIPTSYHTSREDEMTRYGAEIVRLGRDYEEAVQLSSEDARALEMYDANPGAINIDIQLKAYGEIAHEIYDELRDAPAAVAVPVSNGTTLAGIYKGFQTLYRRGKISRLPRMIAGSSAGKNPIINSYKKGYATYRDLSPEKIRESQINEPLINWHSIDGEVAFQAIRESGGWAENVSDHAMLEMAKFLKNNEGLSVLPASTAGLSAMLQFNRQNPLPGDRYVVVITGRK
jgi:threonine synthase